MQKRCLSMLIVLFALVGFAAMPQLSSRADTRPATLVETTRPVAAQRNPCWCAVFARQYYGLPVIPGYPDAKSYVVPNAQGLTWMNLQGFAASPEPQVEGFIVLQPGTATAGGYGHIGIVRGVTAVQEGDKTVWAIQMLSANWGSPRLWYGTEAGCTNVSLSMVYITAGTPGATFWVRAPQA